MSRRETSLSTDYYLRITRELLELAELNAQQAAWIPLVLLS